MPAFLLALMLLPGNPPAFALVVDGAQRGEFRHLQAADGDRQLLVLEDGWIDRDVLALWWPLMKIDPGRYEQDAAGCDERPVTIEQTLGQGLRGRKRSWTLTAGCPVAWEIDSADENGILRMISLSFAGRAIAVAR